MFTHRRSIFSKRVTEAKPWAAVGTWFVGPKAENADVFKDLMTEAIDSHFKLPARVIEGFFFQFIREIGLASSFLDNKSRFFKLIIMLRRRYYVLH